MHDFKDANILITGAASGIGAATATLLAQSGAKKLILVDMDEERLADFAFTLPCERQLLIGDVADERLWADADLTGLTHAFVNAGIGPGSSSIMDCGFAEWRSIMSTNLDGAFLTLQAAMRAIHAGGQGGAIVLTASVMAMKAERRIAAYGASKAAIVQLARVAAKEGASANIRVNAIAPGVVETPIWHHWPYFQDLVKSEGSEEAAFKAMKVSTRFKSFAKPEELAGQVAFLLSDSSAFITGTCLLSDGGYSL